MTPHEELFPPARDPNGDNWGIVLLGVAAIAAVGIIVLSGS